jgi:ABC-2 type transport system permease protein
MTVVFSTLFKASIENFPVYMLSANILFGFNSESTSQSLYSITGNAGLLSKVYIPKYLFPLSKVISGLVNFGFSFIALLVVIIITGAPLHISLFATFPLLVYMILFSLGISLLLASLFVFFRDMSHLYSIIILVWTYLTPIFYPLEIIPASYQKFINFNPILPYINYFRSITMQGVIPGIYENFICLLIGVISFILGMFVFYKSQDKFVLYM